MINTWISARKWLDKNKQPLPLPRQSARKGLKSFETLVESVSKDVRPRALLDELLRSGLVEVRDDIVHLKTSAFVPKDNFEDTLYYLERGVTSHLDAAVSNVAFNGQPAYFDRMVHYDTIEADKISQLVSSVDTEGMKLLKHINTQAKNSSNKKSERPHSFTLGVYVFHEPVRQNKQGDS